MFVFKTSSTSVFTRLIELDHESLRSFLLNDIRNKTSNTFSSMIYSLNFLLTIQKGYIIDQFLKIEIVTIHSVHVLLLRNQTD